MSFPDQCFGVSMFETRIMDGNAFYPGIATAYLSWQQDETVAALVVGAYGA
ncbi:hypothetical protein RGR602_CH02377 [Rhizobium gallicum bv. gallicum R602sp]|uniref:Uncharacterized protein n=1 Tax=Rhizobium gallicum bv. gallicum R602sp TaxID=1041138 RepID=A0A0B4X588_9HYPH|nr:hypothetical protein RGR602_CH02377 [Rhizobium gallicum bv. gallicum R602sp]